MKKLMTLLMVLALIALCSGLSLAEEAKELSGKDLYKGDCKVCHTEDSDAGEYTPMTYIMEQWEEFFDELWTETHGEVVSQKDKTKKVTEMFDEEMLKKIRKFCVDHAADSEQPMTCG